jgi:hypothetical protein
MVEVIGREVFGTFSLSTFEYICAYAFILYPLVSLPLLTYYWMRSVENDSTGSLMGFELPSVLQKKQELTLIPSPELADVASNVETSAEDKEIVQMPDLRVLPVKKSIQRHGGEEIISTTGRSKITFIGQRNSRNLKVPHSSAGLRSAELKGVPVRSDSTDPSIRSEAGVRIFTDDSGSLLKAAKKIALSSDSTAELRAAALDFLISSQNRDRLCRQRTFLHDSSNDSGSFASSF